MLKIINPLKKENSEIFITGLLVFVGLPSIVSFLIHNWTSLSYFIWIVFVNIIIYTAVFVTWFTWGEAWISKKENERKILEKHKRWVERSQKK